MTAPRPMMTGDGSWTLVAAGHGQTYHSRHGAWREALHVFANASGIAERAAHGAVTVYEVGFGTGLNFLATLAVLPPRHGRLTYVAIDVAPPPPETPTQLRFAAHARDEDLAILKQALAAATVEGETHHQVRPNVTLVLRRGDARTWDCHLGFADIIYHDAFSPDIDVDLWRTPFLAKLKCALKPGGVLVTYCAKGAVRRRLRALGLHVEALAGPPGKRQMTRATRPA